MFNRLEEARNLRAGEMKRDKRMKSQINKYKMFGTIKRTKENPMLIDDVIEALNAADENVFAGSSESFFIKFLFANKVFAHEIEERNKFFLDVGNPFSSGGLQDFGRRAAGSRGRRRNRAGVTNGRRGRKGDTRTMLDSDTGDETGEMDQGDSADSKPFLFRDFAGELESLRDAFFSEENGKEARIE